MLHTGQEAGEIIAHELGQWYVTQKGVVFRLAAQPTRCLDGRHTSSVQLASGKWTTLAWRPETTPLRGGLLRRLWRWLFRSQPKALSETVNHDAARRAAES